jgi:large subunit ribosomal protein L10
MVVVSASLRSGWCEGFFVACRRAVKQFTTKEVNGLAITRTKKDQTIESYLEHLSMSRAVIFSEYRGTSVQQIQKLRNQMRDHNTSIQVVKNTLMSIALERAHMPSPAEHLTGPTAVVFLPDDTAAAVKALLDATRDVETFNVKGAILEGQVLNAEGARDLRNLPGRADVLGQLLGVLQAPASELVRTLEAPASELYRTLEAALRELALTIQAYADRGAPASA